MADINNINTPEEESKAVNSKKDAKAAKPKEKKPNALVRGWKKFAKLCSDTVGELKKVVWTPKADVKKSFRLVIATVVLVSAIIAVVDLASSWVVNSIAGLLG